MSVASSIGHTLRKRYPDSMAASQARKAPSPSPAKPRVHPFCPIQYAQAARIGGAPSDVTRLIAPPYDVLDAQGKEALLAGSERNIVAIDLPHLPAKDLGPPEAYRGAAVRLEDWLAEGTLVQRERPAMFCYRETFAFSGGAWYSPEEKYQKRAAKPFETLKNSPYNSADYKAASGELDKMNAEFMQNFESINFNRKTINRIVIKFKNLVARQSELRKRVRTGVEKTFSKDLSILTARAKLLSESTSR